MKVFKVALSIFSIICTIIGITSFTVLQILDKSISKEHVISKLEEIKIYDQIYDEVQSGFEEYIYQSGLEVEMFEDICTKEKIQNDLMSIIDSIYEGKEAIIDTSIIKQNLDNKINNYVNEQGIEITAAEKENIEKYEDLIADSYGRKMSSYLSLKQLLGKRGIDWIRTIKTYKIAIFIVTIFYVSMIFKINKFRTYTVIGNIGISFFSSGIILKIFNSIINSKIDIDNLIIFTKVLSNSLIYIAREIFIAVVELGNMYIGFGLFIIVITTMLDLDFRELRKSVGNIKKKGNLI